MRDFHPGIVAAGLERALPGTPVKWGWVELPQGAGDLHPVALARRLEKPVFRAEVGDRLTQAKSGADASLVLLPAVLGIENSAAVVGDLSKAVGAPISEIPLPPPSIPGLRLAHRLRRNLPHVECLLGARVTGHQRDGERVTAVHAGATELRANAFVLASGGLLGMGLIAEGLHVREPIFGLPVETPDPGDVKLWAAPRLVVQPFVKVGVRVDRTLRPAGWQNLYVCGRTLAGYDPYTEGCGGGVAIATGWRAGSLAGGAQP